MLPYCTKRPEFIHRLQWTVLDDALGGAERSVAGVLCLHCGFIDEGHAKEDRIQ